jgi:hypothetical protein
VTCADGLLLLSKEEKERYYRERLIDKLGKRHGVDITVTECKVMRVSRQATPIQIMIDKKNWSIWTISCSWVPLHQNNARCTSEIKSRISMNKAVFKKNANLFTNKLDINLRKN